MLYTEFILATFSSFPNCCT